MSVFETILAPKSKAKSKRLDSIERRNRRMNNIRRREKGMPLQYSSAAVTTKGGKAIQKKRLTKPAKQPKRPNTHIY